MEEEEKMELEVKGLLIRILELELHQCMSIKPKITL